MSVNYPMTAAWHETMPDPAIRPDLYDGVLWRRAFAYLIDAFCIGVIWVCAWIFFAVLTVLSLGLLWPFWFLLGLVPLAYHSLLLSGAHSATFGMRAFDLRANSWNGERPIFLQALAHALIFYLSMGATCGLILLFLLFNRRKRTFHDVLSGILMTRGPARVAAPYGASWPG